MHTTKKGQNFSTSDRKAFGQLTGLNYEAIVDCLIYPFWFLGNHPIEYILSEGSERELAEPIEKIKMFKLEVSARRYPR